MTNHELSCLARDKRIKLLMSQNTGLITGMIALLAVANNIITNIPLIQ